MFYLNDKSAVNMQADTGTTNSHVDRLSNMCPAIARSLMCISAMDE